MAHPPDWITPMAATLTQDRFTDPGWVFERKYDGIRLLAFKRGAEVKLYSRNRLLQQLPGIEAAVARLPMHDAILDGEVTWAGGDYHIFDVPWLDGRDLMGQPLFERHAVLASLPLSPPLHAVTWIDHPQPWQLAADNGWEGVIAKRRDAVYEQRRSPLWLKMKCEATQELVVGGFTEPRGRRVGFGALLVGHFDGQGRLVFAGKVGTGFDTKRLLSLRARLDERRVAECPFTVGTGLPKAAHWVRPELVVQVAFIEWTTHGKLRHPRLIGVRDDKDARQVVRESP
ncbi:MAG TPA: ATP-dependent DNA ligase [Polyangia bacterium]